MPSEPTAVARLVGKNVAKHILGKQHVEIGGTRQQRHGGGVHQHVRKLYIRITLPDASDHIPPQARTVEHVGLVNRK